jgi:antagonist of KipI
VPVSGACDAWGLAQANLLVGNERDAAAIEATFEGPALRVLVDAVVAIGGADLVAHVPEEFRDLSPGSAHRLRAGTTVRFDARGQMHANAQSGMRAYIAVPGGVDVAEVLESAATYLTGGFGGLEGRALRAGDRIGALRPGELGAAGRTWPVRVAPPPYGRGSLRVVRGPHADLLGRDVVGELLAAEWRVQPESDRSGVRLATDATGIRHPSAEIVSLPMVWGAVQVPPDGRPILLLGDYQTVGGYPVAAVVIRADWPRLGQLAPGSSLRFDLVDIAEAQRAWREQRAGLDAAAQALRTTDVWDALPDAVG